MTKTASFVLLLLAVHACSPAAREAPPPPAGPIAIAGDSKTLSVRGEYRSISVERVEGLALDNGKVSVRSPSGNVPVDLPESADTTRPNRRWVLVSEADTDGKRVVNFTHEESVEDFTLELPSSDATLRYGTFSGRAGGDVMVFAWGDQSQCYWGYVTIAHKPDAAR